MKTWEMIVVGKPEYESFEWVRGELRDCLGKVRRSAPWVNFNPGTIEWAKAKLSDVDMSKKEWGYVHGLLRPLLAEQQRKRLLETAEDVSASEPDKPIRKI